MYNLGSSFEFQDAIEDLKRIFESNNLKVKDDELIRIAMKLVKAEQQYKLNDTLNTHLSAIADILNYPFNPLISSIESVANSIENLGDSHAPF
ncbi:hypothetical protein MUA52_09340 [Staphylococcus agnetis]|uniref:hypothetical protein n=1 Tax=Staphylococcus agnetis TaxID=985762 RepID=UPI0021CE1945|nr:hypothetical protein [Staphylococcus agnetis]UXU66026.1 hypothetical protein MUA52_09340 [Staphylococcus agnetis]